MRHLFTILVLMAMWAVLSGKFDALHLGLGALSAVLVTIATARWRSPHRLPLLRLAFYLPWLMIEIFKSNLRVAGLVLFGRKITPKFMRLPPGVQGDWALATLGCSITLTPGTVTVEMASDQMTIHVLDEASAADLVGGSMARRVAQVFPQTQTPHQAGEGRTAG